MFKLLLMDQSLYLSAELDFDAALSPFSIGPSVLHITSFKKKLEAYWHTYVSDCRSDWQKWRLLMLSFTVTQLSI